MDGRDVSGFIARSADAVLEYIEAMRYVTDPPLGVSVTGVRRCAVGEGYAVLHLESQLQDASGLMLMVDGDVLDEDEAGFTRYDEISRTIVVRPPDAVLDMLSVSGTKVSVLTDMGFLIRAVADFYRRYGDMLALPERRLEPSTPVYPIGSSPSIEQMSAVSCVLSNGISYIWGAPGTGKTQYVLATCIRAVVEAGGRVAVFAPTNNSVEQVLRGIIKAFDGDSRLTGSILRLGVPTRAFYSEHPEMSEDRQAQRRLDACHRMAECLEEVMYERACDCLEGEILDAIRIAREASADSGKVLLEDVPELREAVDGLRGFLSMRPDTRDRLRDFDDRDAHDVLSEIRSMIYDRQRPAVEIEEYSSWSDADLLAVIFETEREIEEMRTGGVSRRLEDARIIASTPHQFISRLRPRGSREDGRPELYVDHIFLDEAGYCGLMQAASLFTNGVPVTFLGDHMQLPPVSQLDDEVLRSAAQRGGRLRYGFLWSLSAIYCEQLLYNGPGSLVSSFVSGADPEFCETARGDLTQSHRFGTNLARVLDRFVYRNGLSGSPEGGDLSIECLDVVCDHRDGRENLPEALAIRQFLKEESPDASEIAILTPYSVQLALLKRKVGRKYRDSVMTVHGSQGREWDTVILSVADNGIASRDVPLRFTSSQTPIGMKVVNTAVSRAKRRLIVVCDRGFWTSRKDELIGGILGEIPPDRLQESGGTGDVTGHRGT